MSDPRETYIKSIPDETSERLTIVMDKAGFEMFDRLIRRAQPTREDSPAKFRAVKDRVTGAFIAGAVVMGWVRK